MNDDQEKPLTENSLTENTLTAEPLAPAVPPSRPRRRRPAMPLDPRRSPSDLGAEQQAEPIPGEAPAQTGNAVSIAGGVAVLRGTLRTVTGRHGVHVLLDRRGVAICAGKARILKSRIQDYTHPA